MGFYKKTIKEYDLSGKRVLLRVDYNVPIEEDGSIADDYRIQKSIPTINYLLEQGCSLVLCSHLGRPSGPSDKKCSLAPVSKRLAELLQKEVRFAGDCVGELVRDTVSSLKSGDVLLLENLRYHPEEEANDETFAKQLAEHGEVFVQDGFGVVHRAHASTDAVTRFLPSVAGLLLEKEVDTISTVMEQPQKPLMAIIGGAKIADKIDILNRFLDIADIIAVGGAMSNTFLLAEGIEIGESKADEDDIPLAKEIMEKARAKQKKQHFVFYLPQDGVVASAIKKTARTRVVDWDGHVFATVENYPKRPHKDDIRVDKDESILDIGPFSGAFIAGSMQLANTVVWNGTMGVTETEGLQGPVGPFAHGTELLVDAMLGQFGHKPYSVVGGGDTVAYLEERKLTEHFDHVSTGGGASLELMSGKSLPGVEALLDKDS